MSEQFSIPTPGDLVAGKYRVIEELGRGSYGVVLRARQDDIDRDVALKTLLPQAFLQADIVERFKREAQLISRLDHPNIIRLYDYGVDEGLLYMAVEYVEGRTLQELIDSEAPLPAMQVVEIAAQILGALEAAHEEGIVHRDLKPDNIVLLRGRSIDGELEESVKVLDFGIAKLLAGEKEHSALKTLTQSGTVLGTPYYMSPENIVGDPVDHRADLYALGIMLYEMLVGCHPFDANTPSAVMVRHLRDALPVLPEGVRATHLGAAIRGALEKQPEQRIASASEMREMILSTTPPPPELATLSAERESDGMRRPTVIALVVALLLILVGSIAWKVRWAFDAVDQTGPSVAAAVSGEAPAGQEGIDEEEPGLVFEALEPEADAAAGAEQEAERIASVAAGSAERIRDAAEADTASALQAGAPRRARRRAPEPSGTHAATKKVRLSIDSTPSNASVMVNGKPVGYTPLDYAVPAGEQVVIRLSHIGYKNELLRLSPTRDEAVRARLEKDRIKLID